MANEESLADSATSTATGQALLDALLDISRSGLASYQETIDALLSKSAQALGAARVGYWALSADEQAIVCESLYVQGQGISHPGIRLERHAAPRYFDAILTLPTLAAEDAQCDPHTAEFTEGYLKPLGIGAMLDVPVRLGGDTVGIVCHEHVGGPRRWSENERMFSCAVAALCSQLMEHQNLAVAQAERQHVLFHDVLTGLPNRVLFLERLPMGEAGRDAVLMVVDVQRFSEVNEAYGAETGDRLLADFAQRIERLAEGERVGRIGDDDFAVLLENDRDATRAHALAEAIQREVQAPLHIDGRDIPLHAAIGILPDLSAYREAHLALRDATLALKAAIRQGQRGIEVFREHYAVQARNRLELIEDLHRAVALGEFRFHLQPIVRAGDACLIGAEALLRWQHPQRGLLAPAAFLEAAESAGLLARIQLPLLQELFARLRRWRALPGFESLAVSVNLAAEQLSAADFAGALLNALGEAGLGMDALHLEITENTLLSADGEHLPGLQRLISRRALLALDDFGTGYATLNHLVDLPLHSIKLDRRFVLRAMEDAKFQVVVRHLIALAQALSLHVVAEGVETEAQFRFLADAGCDAVQGYWTCRPLELPEFERRWLL